MWVENKIFREDLDYIIHADFIEWDKLQNKTVFVTGATGLIGFYVVNSFIYYNKVHNTHIKVLALVRDLGKAQAMYERQLQDGADLHFILGEVEELPEIEEFIDYIIHGAGPTASAFFVEKPVETIKGSLIGAINVLELAKRKAIKGMVYLSTMEVYGAVQTHEKVSEEHACYLSTMKSRNSYPESKRVCENLCASYADEYGVPVNCIRLTQTFGPGINYNDKRIFALFIRAVMQNKDITLLTEGKTCRSYLYLADATTAILKVLSSDRTHEVYNAANEETYCSIKEMAELVAVASELSNGKIQVHIQLSGKEITKNFMPELYMNLDTKKLRGLGWKCNFNLNQMYERTIHSIQYK